MTFYLDIAIILSIVLSINIILVHQNIDKVVSRETYNIAISTIVLLIAAILAEFDGPAIPFGLLPLTLASLVIKNGPDTRVDEAEYGLSITILCISLSYFAWSGIFYKLLDFWDLPKNIFGVR